MWSPICCYLGNVITCRLLSRWCDHLYVIIWEPYVCCYLKTVITYIVLPGHCDHTYVVTWTLWPPVLLPGHWEAEAGPQWGCRPPHYPSPPPAGSSWWCGRCPSAGSCCVTSRWSQYSCHSTSCNSVNNTCRYFTYEKFSFNHFPMGCPYSSWTTYVRQTAVQVLPFKVF